MTKRQRGKVETLERRAAFLDRRIAEWQPPTSPSYELAEVAAIRWAVGIARAADDAEVLAELEARIGVEVPA